MSAVFLLILGVIFLYLTATGRWAAMMAVVKGKSP